MLINSRNLEAEKWQKNSICLSFYELLNLCIFINTTISVSIIIIILLLLNFITTLFNYPSPNPISLLRKLNEFGLDSVQIALLANLHPDNVEQARALIPSLHNVDEAIIQKAIETMTLLRKEI